ncbi:MAG: hypothetical protein L3J56_01030 [Bacteroidales bacterium]|nr:hypothetical protein [Bacteroidales bacterium]
MISIKETRKNYERAEEIYNSKFYDETGKFIREGSRKLYLSHKEIFIALVVIMNNRLKIRNYSNSNPVPHNFYRHPFSFYVGIKDIINVLSQHNKDKKVASPSLIKRALIRFADPSLSFILHKKYRRSKYRYEVVLNPLLIAFYESFSDKSAKNTTSLKSVVSKSKNTNCSIITPILTIKNNKTSNQIDFQIRSNLQANSNFNNLNNEKSKPAENIDFIVSNGSMPNINDNRPIKEKRKEKTEISGEIFNNLKTLKSSDIAENIKKNIEKMLLPARKSQKITSDAEKRKIEDFLHFKKRIIINFYVYFLSILFEPKIAEKYNPNDTDSPFYIYTLQAIRELAENEKYFGKCKTVFDYEDRLKFLKFVVFSTKKGWINKRKDFNMKFVAPNLYLSGHYKRFKFLKAVEFYENKLKKIDKNYKPAEKKITAKQFQSALDLVAKILNRPHSSIPADETFRKYIFVRFDEKEETIKCRAKFNYETFK